MKKGNALFPSYPSNLPQMYGFFTVMPNTLLSNFIGRSPNGGKDFALF